MKVLNFGSLNYDYVYRLPHIMMPGETQTSLSRNVFFGGKGLNQSIALARAGVPVCHAGCVGEDGQAFLDLCKENGIDMRDIQKTAGPSGHTMIQIDDQGQNCILLYPGANRMQTREHIDEVLTGFGEGDILLLQNEINELDYIIDRAYDRGMTIVLNPSPFDDYLNACDFDKISVFLVNEIEGGQMTGEQEPEKILDTFRLRYPHAKVVLTLGSDGSWYQDAEQRIYQECLKVQAVDTTAAGDTFTGYFIAGMIAGTEPSELLQICSRASAIAVSRSGAADSIPYRAEVIPDVR